MTTEQLKKMGYVDNGTGVYVPIKSLTTPAHKVKKLGNILERALMQDMPNNGVLNGSKVYIKPLSVNDAWKGQRFKTDEYRDYDLALTLLLPKNIVIPAGKLSITFKWGLSSDGGDWDAPIKQAQDIIARKYRFNDNRIVRGIVEKEIVPKGKEYLEFKIEKYNEPEKRV